MLPVHHWRYWHVVISCVVCPTCVRNLGSNPDIPPTHLEQDVHAVLGTDGSSAQLQGRDREGGASEKMTGGRPRGAEGVGRAGARRGVAAGRGRCCPSALKCRGPRNAVAACKAACKAAPAGLTVPLPKRPSGRRWVPSANAFDCCCCCPGCCACSWPVPPLRAPRRARPAAQQRTLARAHVSLTMAKPSCVDASAVRWWAVHGAAQGGGGGGGKRHIPR